MKIAYLGHSCFQFTSKNGTILVTDPFTKVGYELPPYVKADIVTISHGHFDHNFVAGIQGDFQLVDSVQERQINGIRIQGIESWHDGCKGLLRGNNIVYKMHIDGVTVCHMGDLGECVCNELVKRLGKIDVLLVPVGGTYTIDAAQAKAWVDALRPAIVIPMHFKPADGALDIASVDEFLSFWQEVVYSKGENQAVLTAQDVKEGEIKIMYLERANKDEKF